MNKIINKIKTQKYYKMIKNNWKINYLNYKIILIKYN